MSLFGVAAANEFTQLARLMSAWQSFSLVPVCVRHTDMHAHPSPRPITGRAGVVMRAVGRLAPA